MPFTTRKFPDADRSEHTSKFLLATDTSMLLVSSDVSVTELVYRRVKCEDVIFVFTYQLHWLLASVIMGTANYELRRIWKMAAVTELKTPSQKSLLGTDKNDGNLHIYHWSRNNRSSFQNHIDSRSWEEVRLWFRIYYFSDYADILVSPEYRSRMLKFWWSE
jgi:hypothetical protein